MNAYRITRAIRLPAELRHLPNREYNLAFLKSKDIPFVDLNDGVHVRVVLDGETIDFYPSTGLYILKDGTRGSGIFNLWKLVKDRL